MCCCPYRPEPDMTRCGMPLLLLFFRPLSQCLSEKSLVNHSASLSDRFSKSLVSISKVPESASCTTEWSHIHSLTPRRLTVTHIHAKDARNKLILLPVRSSDQRTLWLTRLLWRFMASTHTQIDTHFLLPCPFGCRAQVFQSGT